MNAFTGSVKAFTLVEIAGSIALLVSSMEKIAALSGGEVVGGVTAIGGIMTELNLSLKSITKTVKGVKTTDLIKTGAALIEFAKAVDMLANAMSTIGNLKWDEIAKGLTGMGGAMAELVAAAKGLSYAKVDLKTAGSLIAMAQAVKMVADPLKKLGNMSWDQVGKGLSAMGGALTEMGTVTGLLGRFGKHNISAAVSMVVTAKSLGDIAKAFNSFSQYSWDEIGRGLSAMGGALGEVGLVSGALGKLAGLSGLIGAGTINLTVQGLDEIAQAFNSFSQYSWDEIGRGLVAMGGAMGEVAAISGATGALTGIAGLMGAGTITLASQGLIDLATAFGKFAEFNWDEIGRGLTAMGAAMGETALGGLLNTFSGFGASAIEKMAAPLGTLADSIKKWEGVAVPDDLADQLGRIADGVGKFTLAGWGSDTIANIAQPMNTLTNAVAKWSTITFPTDIATQLGSLANGVKAFTLAFAGGWSLNAVVGPLGTLADSVKKWDGVEVPGGIQGNLTALANGVKAFTLAFAGGWSIDAVIGPLGQLPGAVKKWNGVEVPGGIQGNLTALANGVKAFTLAFVGGWSINAVIGPLGQLAGEVKKWNGVEVPGGIQGNLTALANGVKAFTGIGSGIAESMSNATSGVRSIATAATSLSAANLSGVSKQISTFVSSLNNTQSITSTLPADISAFATQLNSAMVTLGNVVSTNGSTISTGFTQFKTSVTNGLSGVGSIVSQNMSSMSTAIIGGLDSIISVVLAFAGSMGNALNESTTSTAAGLQTTVDRINSFQSQFRTAGQHLADGLLNGMRSNSSQFTGVFSSSVNQAVNSVRAYYNGFYDAGRYLVEGFTNGINDYTRSAATAAANMASSAKTAADRALDNGSPSKIMMQVGRFFTEGFSIGITDREDMVSDSSEKVAQKAISTLNDMLATSSIDDLFDASPTITPVLDLSAINKQAGSIDSMLSRSIAPSEAELREIDRRFRQNESGSRTAEKDTSGPKSVNIEYNQTLNSPTSLSRYDIYRQTSNQLKLLRQELKMSPIGK